MNDWLTIAENVTWIVAAVLVAICIWRLWRDQG
jgi:hypothetical protein